MGSRRGFEGPINQSIAGIALSRNNGVPDYPAISAVGLTSAIER